MKQPTCLRMGEPMVIDLSNRLAAASEVLGQLAQRDGRVNEIMRLRLTLERITESHCVEEAKRLAREGLRW